MRAISASCALEPMVLDFPVHLLHQEVQLSAHRLLQSEDMPELIDVAAQPDSLLVHSHPVRKQGCFSEHPAVVDLAILQQFTQLFVETLPVGFHRFGAAALHRLHQSEDIVELGCQVGRELFALRRRMAIKLSGAVGCLGDIAPERFFVHLRSAGGEQFRDPAEIRQGQVIGQAILPAKTRSSSR